MINKFEQIKQRINDLAPGQILSYFKFFPVQSEKDFSLYKNDEHVSIIIYKETNEELCFIEMLEFNNLTKTELFYFLVNSFDKKEIIKIISEIVDITEYITFSFKQNINSKTLINSYFNLEGNEVFEESPISDFIYKRYERDCMVFYKNKKPIDIVVFDEFTSSIYSEFGNNFGIHSIKGTKKGNAILTYNPNDIINYKGKKGYSIILTKYFYSEVEVFNSFLEAGINNVFIPSEDLNGAFYKLSFILSTLNLYNNNGFISLSKSPNSQYFEIKINFNGGPKEKLNIFSFFSTIQNDIKLLYENAPNDILTSLQKYFNFDIQFFNIGNKYIAHIVFKKKLELLQLITSSYLNEIKKIDKFPFYFEE